MRKKGFKLKKPLSGRTVYSEARYMALGQIFLEKNQREVDFLISSLRVYYDEYNHPIISEAIKEEKAEIAVMGKKITKWQFIMNINNRVVNKKKE